MKQEKTKKFDDPYLITAEDFSKLNDFDKESLTYFVIDDLFVDDNDDVVQNGMQLVGPENLAEMENSQEPGVIYVRNEEFGKDFEVFWNEDTSYESYIAENYH